ncbi:alpha-ketoglutarate-dependent dioxygenase AlkB [Tsuneonella sp. HG249]
MADQLTLFDPYEPHDLPEIGGLAVVRDAVTTDHARELEARVDQTALSPFQFGQWEGKRLTANYGSAYDYQRARPKSAPPMPAWLRDLCNILAPQVGRDPNQFVQALVTRYDPGAGIGWHRDRPQYGEVIGLSLGAFGKMRLRRRCDGGAFQRAVLPLLPRSVYLLSGSVRWEWEHSIVPLAETRRSITLRTLREV